MGYGIYLVNQNSGKTYPLLPDGLNVIGRGIGEEENPEATILLPHPAISKKHAKLYLEAKTQIWHLQNYSGNGAKVNDREINESVALRHGDEIAIGPYRLVFYEKFRGDATMEQKKPETTPSQWEDRELTPLGTFLETVAIFFLLALTGFILYCCFG